MTTLSTYSQQRDALNATIAAQAPADLLQGLVASAQRLDEIDFAATAPQLGDPAPDFALPNHNGDRVELSALLREGPVVLIFYRGEWCPYCNLQLRSFQAHLADLAEHGARLVAISPQTPDHSLSTAEKNGLGFLVLSDVGAEVIARYGVGYRVDDQLRQLLESSGNDVGGHNGETGWALPAPSTFVIDSGGAVRFARVRGDWTERAEPAEVLAVLAELSALDRA